MSYTDNDRVQKLIGKLLFELYAARNMTAHFAASKAYNEAEEEDWRSRVGAHICEARFRSVDLRTILTVDYVNVLDLVVHYLEDLERKYKTMPYEEIADRLFVQAQLIALLQCFSKRLDYVPSSSIEPDESEDNGPGPLEPLNIEPDQIEEDETPETEC